MQGPRFDGALSKALQGKEEGLREEPSFVLNRERAP